MSGELSEIPPPPGVGLVQKTLQLLELFQTDAPHWSQSDIARTTGMPRSTVSRLVKFLTGRGYLSLVEGRNLYSLGPAAMELGRRATAVFDFRGLCRPVLERLAGRTRETVILTSLVTAGNAVRCVDQIESSREGLRVFEQIGSIFPLHAGASPRAVLASLDPGEQEHYLARPLGRVTKRTIIDIEALRTRIAETRRLGYAVSADETYEGVTGIGAAFFWGSGRPAGSLAVAMPSQRAGEQEVVRIGSLLKAASAELTARLATGAPSGRTGSAA